MGIPENKIRRYKIVSGLISSGVCKIASTGRTAATEDQRRTVARALLTPCEPIFAGYALGDDFASRPEFRQLKAELRLGIRQWIDDNGPPGYEAKLRHRVRTRKMRDGEPKKTNRNK